MSDSDELVQAAVLGALLLVAVGCASSYTRPEFSAYDAYTSHLVLKYQTGLLPSEAWSTKVGRNQVLDELLYLCDVSYSEYEVGLYQSDATFNTVSDILVMAISAGGAVATGGASQALSAVTGGLAGARSVVDKNYFLEQSRVALIARMDALRLAVRSEIEGRKTLRLALYPLSAAMLDVQAYYQAGTLLSALKAVAEDSGQQLQAARRDFKAARRSTAGSVRIFDEDTDPPRFSESDEVEIFSPPGVTEP